MDQKVFAVLGYLFLPLFFMPLLNEKMKHHRFTKFHANQQMILLIVALAVYFMHSVLFIFFQGLSIYLVQAVNVGIFALALYGAYYAYEEERKELPLLGQFKILK